MNAEYGPKLPFGPDAAAFLRGVAERMHAEAIDDFERAVAQWLHEAAGVIGTYGPSLNAEDVAGRVLDVARAYSRRTNQTDLKQEDRQQ